MIFIAKDPRGYEVRLTDECWYNHILMEHAEMKGRIDDVRRAIETPDYIYQSKYKRSSHLYFLEAGRSPSGVAYVLVVVAVRQRAKRGYVQTAFLVEGLSKGGKLLWKKP
jgi:hypothetical protein